jgi:ankyrin repeat protein
LGVSITGSAGVGLGVCMKLYLIYGFIFLSVFYSGASSTVEKRKLECDDSAQPKKRIHFEDQDELDVVNQDELDEELFLAIHEKSLEKVRAALDNGASIEAVNKQLRIRGFCKKPQNYGDTPLLYAVDEGANDIVRFLLERGANVKAIDADGLTVLHYAAQLGDTELVSLFIENYFAGQLDIGEFGNWRPLHYAARAGRIEVVDILCSHGADSNALDNEGRTALHHIAEERVAPEDRTAANFAVQERRMKTIYLLVNKFGANVNCASDQQELLDDQGNLIQYPHTFVSPLYVAAEHNNAEAIEALLLCKANPNQRGFCEDGLTPLHIAAEYGCFVGVEFLMRHGADVNATLGRHEKTPLSYAVDGAIGKKRYRFYHSNFEEFGDHRGVICLLFAVSDLRYSNLEKNIVRVRSNGRFDLADLLSSSFRQFCKNPSFAFLKTFSGPSRQQLLDELLLYSFWMRSQPLIDQLLAVGASQKGAYELARQEGYLSLDQKPDRNPQMLRALALREMRQLI